MKLIKAAKKMYAHTQEKRTLGKKTGFIPTMGALHDGHISLIKQAQKETDYVVVSIFINPTQFNNASDFEKYPNQIEEDIKLLKFNGVDCVFLPNTEEMYKQETPLKFDFGYLEKIMEGAFRPGHFHGVATIVSKLFNVISPDKAYFGQKDIQQVAIIKALTTALSFQIDLIIVPTLRESSGLAMSSRNQRLSHSGLIKAAALYQSLTNIEKQLQEGVTFKIIQEQEITKLEKNHGFSVEYLELTEAENLRESTTIKPGKYAICIAAYLQDVRLIDNLVFISE